LPNGRATPEVAWKGMGDMRARERSGALPPPEFPRAACNEHVLKASKQIATVGSDLPLRQLEAQCELPPSLSRPFGGRNAEHARGLRLALVVGSFPVLFLVAYLLVIVNKMYSRRFYRPLFLFLPPVFSFKLF
jgi:hypothetical protein